MQGDFCAVPRLGREAATRISFDKGFVAALLNSVGIGGGGSWDRVVEEFDSRPKVKQMLKSLYLKVILTSWCIVLWVAAIAKADVVPHVTTRSFKARVFKRRKRIFSLLLLDF